MMGMVFKTVLSMSVSGSLFILLLFAGKSFFKNRCSRQWQYYIWLVVILRLLLPFGPEISLMMRIHQTCSEPAVQEIFLTGQEKAAFVSELDDGLPENVPDVGQAEERAPGKYALGERTEFFLNGISLIWLAAVFGLLIRKITAYQDFVRYVRAGASPVLDGTLLEIFFEVKNRAGVDREVGLCVNPLLSSPTLIGIFYPCIVLPDAGICEKDFRYIMLHELTHCKRWDILYKWLVQIVVCLHWFNPLVHWMGREAANACEFSCDEAVVARMGYENAGDYGKTLLDAMAAVGKYSGFSGALGLSENKRLLRERLEAVMNCREKSVRSCILAAGLTVCMVLGVVFVGVYPTRAAEVPRSLTTDIQTADRENILLEKPSEGKGNGGSEKAEWEAEFDEKLRKEYQAAGVTAEGKNYYYQGQLIHVFLDLRPDKSCYTLQINPTGTVDVKICRGEDGQITGAAYLSKEEFEELFGEEEMRAGKYPRTMYVNSLVCRIRAGAGEEFPVVGLAAQGDAVTVLELVEGSGERNWYRIEKDSLEADLDESAKECYIRGDLLRGE